MPARVTIERLLRDEEDAMGQTIREWKIESEPAHVTIRLRHGDGFILMRTADVEVFIADLKQARDAAFALAEDGE